MTSQEASGSFMLVGNVIEHFNFNEFELEGMWRSIVEIDNISYVPTSVIKVRMSEQDWRQMQSEVTTSMFGIEPIIFI